MRYLIHGDDNALSRNFLTSLTEGYSVTILDGKSLTIKILEENLFSTSLFDEKKAVVVENFLSKNAKKKEIVSFLNAQTDTVLFILWEEKKLLKTSFSNIKNATVKEFFLPSSYFQFLDSFSQKNGKRLFLMYQDLLKTTSAEQIFYSLIKRLRLLMMLGSQDESTELSKMAPWQKSKLQQQVRMWDVEKLKKFYFELQKTEVKLKTGKLPTGLSKHLDTLILSQLT